MWKKDENWITLRVLKIIFFEKWTKHGEWKNNYLGRWKSVVPWIGFVMLMKTKRWKKNACGSWLKYYDSLNSFRKFCLGDKELPKWIQGSIVLRAKNKSFLKFIQNSIKKCRCFFYHYFTCNRFSEPQCVMTCKNFWDFVKQKKLVTKI